MKIKEAFEHQIHEQAQISGLAYNPQFTIHTYTGKHPAANLLLDEHGQTFAAAAAAQGGR